MVAEHAQHLGELVDIGAAAAEFARHAGLDQAGGLEQRKVVGDEGVLVGVGGGAFGERRAESHGDLDGRASISTAAVALGQCQHGGSS